MAASSNCAEYFCPSIIYGLCTGLVDNPNSSAEAERLPSTFQRGDICKDTSVMIK